MGRAVHVSLSIAALAALIGIMSCREPTQITVAITTDTKCPTEPLTGPRLVDVMFAAGIKVDPKTFVEVTTTPDCTPPPKPEEGEEPAFGTVGTLVLLPSGGDPGVEVLVVAGVEISGPKAEISPLKLGSGECKALIQADGVGAIGGKPCILSRRRLGFVEHTKLELPIDLDSRCIGKKCGEDETCFKGNCISLEVACDEGGCRPPDGCPDDCDAACASGTGVCEDGGCRCLTCDSDVCGDSCALSQAVGVCDDDVCICKTCDQAACTADCDGQCSAETGDCVCQSCDAGECTQAGPDCSCPGAPQGCQCVVADCMTASCAAQPCAAGQIGECGVNEAGMDTCTCTCDNTKCDTDCDFGGGCDEDGACACNPPCMDSQCTSQACAPGKVDRCYDGGCACVCDPDECSSDCGPQGGTCNQPGSPQGTCTCTTGGTGGAPPTGG
ncbi:MAG: hypothetical protein JNK04_20035, partial [Myxococcales bacterium]|nr:hypothetical protein [Myxococcales bacterium]